MRRIYLSTKIFFVWIILAAVAFCLANKNESLQYAVVPTTSGSSDAIEIGAFSEGNYPVVSKTDLPVTQTAGISNNTKEDDGMAASSIALVQHAPVPLP